MRGGGDLTPPAGIGVAPARVAQAETLGVDLVAASGCVGVAILIFHRVMGAAGVLPVLGARGPHAYLAAGLLAVGVGFAAAHRGPLAGYPAARQFLRFGCAGLLNAAIDFGTLNLLVFLSGVYGGIGIVPLNVMAFAAASLNSFTWNKLWTFRRPGRAHLAREVGAFYVVAISGLAINSTILWAVTALVPRPVGLPPIAWLNAAKLAAAITASLWDFVWYRGSVFRPEDRGFRNGR